MSQVLVTGRYISISHLWQIFFFFFKKVFLGDPAVSFFFLPSTKLKKHLRKDHRKTMGIKQVQERSEECWKRRFSGTSILS